MNAIDAKVGQKYLSKKGTPVTVVGHKGDKVTLKISGSENEIDVAKNYELPSRFAGRPAESAIQTAIQRVSSKVQRPIFRYIRRRINQSGPG